MARLSDSDFSAAPSPQPSRLSDADFDQPAGVASIGSTGEDSFPVSDYNRMRDSFGDAATQKKAQSDKFTQHPLNWLESRVGSALPNAGMMGGALIGAGGGPVGSIAGAGVGGGVGEYLRNGIGKIIGNNQDDINKSALKEGLTSMASETGGKVLGKGLSMIPGVPEAANYVADRTVRPALTGLSRLLSFGAVDKDAAMRLLQRPEKVLGSTASAAIQDTANKASQELATNTAAEQQAYDQAQRQFFSEAPPKIPTTNSVQAVNRTLNRPGYMPNSSGQGALSGDDVEELLNLEKSLKSPTGQTQQVPWQRPTEVTPDTPLYRGKHPENGKGAWTMNPDEAVSHAGPDGKVQQARVGDIQGLDGDLTKLFSSNEVPVPLKGVPRQTYPAKGFPTTTDAPVIGNEQTPEELVGTLQELRKNSTPGAYTAKGSAKFRSDAMGGSNKAVMGGLKQDLYNAGEPGKQFLGANDRFHQFAQNADMVKGLENPATAESTAAGMFGKNKLNMRDAAQKVLPGTYDELADIGANKSFNGGDVVPKFGGPSARAIGMGTVGLGLAPFNHVAGAALLGLGAASHPMVQKQILGTAGKLINNQTLPAALKATSPWLMDQFNEKEKKK